MINPGKEHYHDISIPDDKLLDAIGSGMRKGKRYQRNKRIQTYTAAAACMMFLLFGCANVPVLYTYASEIPIVKTFVQAMRIGKGGAQLEEVSVSVDTGSNYATISFLADGEITDYVLAYSAEYFQEPSRLQMTFSGMSESMFETLKESLIDMKAVKDIYRVPSDRKGDITFVIELNGIYNYELMEFSNPGSLTLSFYQDAYYTEE